MHISNMYLSEPKYENYGINVWGPMLGVTIRFGGERRQHVAAGRKPGGAVDATAPGNP
jgi:hypothetical protein